MRDAAKVHSFTITLHLDKGDWDIEVTVPNFEGTHFIISLIRSNPIHERKVWRYY